ncbi:hypothetical protein [Acidipila sp. EB88]|uniref:hypothetical protein n=1 Tax=Acidipila sp. EB88 TaxID=2305226 RepID=UPI000F5DD7D6|nr:hypothetical protein [Acidipila sp. EB88]RRA50443.1 hypothetical protein D1Y84_00055 [Acidipila sp. EB88]
MPEARPPIKLDFTSGLDQLPARPKMDAASTQASVIAGREFGFEGRHLEKLDGRRLRSRGANIQLNLKVTEEEKQRIIVAASKLIQDPSSPIKNLGEFVVFAVDSLKTPQS